LSASLGAGLHYDRNEKLHCTLRAKKAIPVASSNRFVNFVLKGRCDIDQELNQPKPQGALELVWNILDFQKDQDVRLKVGYELVDKHLIAPTRIDTPFELWLFEFPNQCHVVLLHSRAIKVEILVRARGMPSIRAWLLQDFFKIQTEQLFFVSYYSAGALSKIPNF
ncbi:outer envelope pore protein 21B, chloroplastic-like protein, partial [Tanacetum coccineum]